MAEGQDGCPNQTRVVPPCSHQLSHYCHRTPTPAPAESALRPSWSGHRYEQDDDAGDHPADTQSKEPPSCRLYEELFCTSQSSVPLVPLAGALMSTSRPQADVVKGEYLGKLEQKHRRYFVLRAGSHTGPSRLEWYKSQEKFTAMEKSAGKSPLLGSNKQGVIYLRCCLGVSRIGSSRKGHTVALYDKAQTMVLVTEDQQQQEDWYGAIKKLMEEEQKEEHAEGVEEDDGYCTLPPASFFKEVWPVTVKPRGLGGSKPFTGENRLCLTATTLVLVRLGASNDLPSVTIPLLSVRRFGHMDGLFFLELGRSAPNGPGEIWMEAREEENTTLAQNIHEAVRKRIQAIRALPNFSRSPSSNQQRALLASKHCRPKSRDKPVNVKSPTPLVLHLQNSNTQSSPVKSQRRPQKPDDTKSESSSHHSPPRTLQSLEAEIDSYMETKMEHCSGSASEIHSWELVQKDEEGREYMVMSPQTSHSLSELTQDDYVIMESPQKLNRPAYSSSSLSSLQTSFSSYTCDSFSPLDLSHHPYSQSNWLVTDVQQSDTQNVHPQVKTSCSAQPQVKAQQDMNSSQTKPTRPCDLFRPMAPFDLNGVGSTIRPQSRANFVSNRSGRPQAVQIQPPIRRHWLSTCLLSCLQTDCSS